MLKLEDSVTDKEIQEWKDKYGYIYRLKTVPITYFKKLTREDYIEITKKQMMNSTFDTEIETCKMCVLNDIPIELYKEYGGLVPVLYEQIMLKSGFVNVEAEEL